MRGLDQKRPFYLMICVSSVKAFPPPQNPISSVVCILLLRIVIINNYLNNWLFITWDPRGFGKQLGVTENVWVCGLKL